MPWRGSEDPEAFPTLGWEILAWSHAYLPSPGDETQPLVYTDEQALRILRWFEIDPDLERFIHETMILEEAKGWGKSPFAGSLEIASLAGPVCFDGWDANGEPVGVPWGTGERPPPWIQIAAVSEDQTDNTYGALYSMLVANDGHAADELRIDAGRTRLFLRDRPGRLEPVTASAGSREGQRLTDAVLDETWLWLQRNGGVKLAGTIRRNLAKMGGRSIETTNAPILGEKSVAEQRNPDKPKPGALYFSHRPSIAPAPDLPEEQMRIALEEVYGDASWVDLERLLREISNPINPWTDSVRFWFNTRDAGAGIAVDPRLWDARKVTDVDVPAGTKIGLGFDGSISRDATVLRGCTREGYSFLIGAWYPKPGDPIDWTVPRLEVHQAVAEAFATYKVGLMLCDPPKWYTEIEQWAQLYGEETVLASDTNQARRFAPQVDRWLTGLREGAHTHDGDPLTTEHVRAAHLKKVRISDPDDDERTLYVLVKGEGSRRIDAAVADVLAYEAAMTMPDAPELEPLFGWA
jgi:hypothetical protein